MTERPKTEIEIFGQTECSPLTGGERRAFYGCRRPPLLRSDLRGREGDGEVVSPASIFAGGRLKIPPVKIN
uniref:Uncharacterized protein n=1 Tax=Oryza meridionalis TaxID=40149 RepID=A0A0E0E0R2_9ORYZ